MKLLVALTFDVPNTDDVVAITDAIDPPSLPHFEGLVRYAADPVATLVTEYLDGSSKPADDPLAAAVRDAAIRPLGQDLSRDYVREVWNAYVKPTQDDNAPPQSMETLALMSILRAVYVALPATESEPAS